MQSETILEVAFEDDLFDGDCVRFEGDPLPNIVSFSSTSNCADADATCKKTSTYYEIKLTDDIPAFTTIQIDEFNTMDYAYTDGLIWIGTYYPDCDTSLADPETGNMILENAFTLAITDVTIYSSTDNVGDTNKKLTVEMENVQFPATGRITLVVPYLYGETSMVSSSSCDLVASNDIDVDGCSFDGSGSVDNIYIDFTTTEGAQDVTFLIGDFDNPLSTTAWGDFTIIVNIAIEDDDGEIDYYGISKGIGFKMNALTVPHPIIASIEPEVGTIDEADTLIIEFTVSGGRIANDCDFELVFPDTIGFDEGNFNSVEGNGCFARSTSGTS